MRSNAKGPFRARYPNGLEYGGYRAYHPQLRKVVAVGSYDQNEAIRIWQSWYENGSGQLRAAVAEHTSEDVEPTINETPTERVSPMINFDDPKPDDVLSSFLAANREPATSTPPPPIPTAQVPRETPIIPINRAPVGRPPKKGQDPIELAKKAERNAKLAAGLKGMVTQVNIVAAGMAVKLFGRNPAEPDEAEIQMLREAWESYIDDMFGKLDVEPWVLLLIGNVMIAMSMYANGEPIPKKQIQQVPGAEGAK